MVKYSITLGLNSAITDFVINFEKNGRPKPFYSILFIKITSWENYSITFGIYWVTSDLMIKFKKKQEKDVTESFL